MKPGDLVRVTRSVTGGGRVRRLVHTDEIGVLVKTHYINDLSVPGFSAPWCDVLMPDGIITLPGWALATNNRDNTCIA